MEERERGEWSAGPRENNRLGRNANRRAKDGSRFFGMKIPGQLVGCTGERGKKLRAGA